MIGILQRPSGEVFRNCQLLYRCVVMCYHHYCVPIEVNTMLPGKLLGTRDWLVWACVSLTIISEKQTIQILGPIFF